MRHIQSRNRARRKRLSAAMTEVLEQRLLLAGDVVISEFMTKNTNGIKDNFGYYSDWIELHNAGDATQDLSGWYLSDSASNLTEWQFPSGTSLAAGAFMIVYASGRDISVLGQPLHTNFSLSDDGEYLGLIQPNGSTIQYQYAPGYPQQVSNASYGMINDNDPNSALGFFSTPTPGATNLPSTGSVTYSQAGGAFTSPVSVSLSDPTAGAQIYYTTNGATPTNASTPYTGPITISKDTMLQTVAYSSSLQPSLVTSQQYFMLDSSVATFNSNIALVVIDTGGPTIQQDSQTAASAMVLAAPTDGSNTTLTESPDFIGRVGLNIRGQTSTSFPKKQYHMEIWDENNNDTDASLLGMGSDSDWVLYAPYSEKSLMQNQLAYMWSNEIGEYAVKTQWCEVFINQSSNAQVNYTNDYMGVYLLMQKIKIAPDRVDITKLQPGEDTYPSVTGGYIWAKDKPDPDDPSETGFTTQSGQLFYYVDPSEDDLDSAQKSYLTNYVNQFEAALYGPNFANPTTGYAAYINVMSFVDNWILVEMAKNIDGFRLSTYYYKDENGKITMGPIWDYNLSMGNANYNDGQNATGWYHSVLDAQDYTYFSRLTQDPHFMALVAERWEQLRQTVFSTPQIDADIQANVDVLTDNNGNIPVGPNPTQTPNNPVVRNFEKWNILGTDVWPNAYVGNSWMDEVNYLENFMNTRVAWMDTQLDPLVSTAPPGTPTSLTATAISGVQVNLSWTPADSNATEYEIDQSSDGEKTWTVAAQVLQAIDSDVVGGLQPNTPYSFRVIASNDLGASAPSNVASATTASAAPWLDLSSGFASSGAALLLNGNAKLSGSNLELTDGGDSEASSAFSTGLVSDSNFSTAFTFQLTSATADGFTFTMQNDGPTALGGEGGDLGYAGLANSVAVKFDLYNNSGEGTDSTGVFADGDVPGIPGSNPADVSVDMTSSGVNLESGDIMLVVLQYNNGALVEKVTDTSTNATFNHTYSINIPTEIGANAAYVGFTAGTGGATAIQNVLGWTFTSFVASPPPPPPPASGITGFTSDTLNAASGGPTGVPAISNDSRTLTITTKTNSEADSAFYNSPVLFQNFVASFTYTDSGGSSPADGFTFTLENSSSGAKVLGSSGGNLGYSGITPSFALEFNNFQVSSTSDAVNGNATFPANVSNTGAIDLRSSDPINVTLAYSSGQYALTETLTDTVSHASFTTIYTDINLSTILGSSGGKASTAYVGFTGATGGTNALQTISNFTYSTSATPPTSPPPPPVATSIGGFANNVLDATSNDPAGVPGVSTDNNTLTLTTAGTYQSSAWFYDAPLDYGNFTANFTYQETGSAPADGAAFVLQELPSGLGQNGGQLAYGPSDPNSFAVEFNIYQVSSTGIGAGGSVGVSYNTGGNTGGVNIASGDPINVTLAYSSGNQTLTETLTDATTKATYSVSYNNINLSQILGNSTSAYVGFTGATGGAGAVQTIRNFSYSANTTLPATAAGPQVNLTGYFNSYGIQNDGTAVITTGSPTNGSFAIPGGGTTGYDGAGNQLSDTFFGAQESVGAYGSTQTFDFGPVNDPGLPNTISAEGQTINLPQGQYGNISFLGSAVNGNQASQVFTVNYTDGTSQSFTLGMSDSLNGPTFAPNEVVAIPMTYRLSSTGAAENQGSNVDIYEYQLATNSAKTVASITLPMNTNIKILAINVNTAAPGVTVAAPTFDQYGGDVPSGFKVAISNPNTTGSIYYTSDGSDPVTQTGTLSPSAILYTGAITIDTTTDVQAVVESGATISPVTDATFYIPVTTVHITELDYDPNPPGDGTYSGDDEEFIELKNFGTQTVDLDGASFTNGIDFTFGNVSLAPGQVGVVVSNLNAFQARYGNSINVLGSYLSSGTHFSNSGEEVTLQDATGLTIADFTYSPSWYPTTAGSGPSLEVVDPASNPNLNLAASWQASPEIGGTPGVDDSIPTAAPQNLTNSFVNQQVVLSWDVTPGAATYNVYQGSSSGGEGSTPIATGITSPTYTDTSAVAGDTYYYTVAAVDPGGVSPQSNEVQVVVPQTPYAPIITTQPLSQIVDVGGTATFTATATGYPVPTIQWQLSSDGGKTWSPIAGATSTTYSFTVNNASLNANEYEAVFTNSQGPTPTNVATLTAIAAPVTAWNFDTSDVTGQPISTKGTNTSPDPSTGAGASSSIGMALVSGPDKSGMTGDAGSSDPGSSNQTWKVVGSNGWSNTAPIGSQGAQFMVNTSGYQDISLQFDLNLTAQGEGKLAVEYTTDGGTTWTNATQLNANGDTGITVLTNSSSTNTIQGQYFDATGGAIWYNRLTVDFNGVAGVANNPSFGVRLVNAATGADCVNSTGGQLDNNSGNWRFDEVDINGALIPPTITAISPASGPIAGGTSVTINGIGFTGATAVDFGSTPATSFTVNSTGTQITAVDPAGTLGTTVDVTVVTPAGTTDTSAADQFTYLPSWLAAGSAAAWTVSTNTLTITGSATIISDPGSAEPNIVASGTAAKLTIAPTTNDVDIHIGGVTLTNGASLVMSDVDASQVASGTNAANHHTDHNVLVIGTLGAVNDPTISIDSASKLDLGDNDLIVHTGSSDTGTTDVQGNMETSELKSIEALAATGRNVAPGGVYDGTWTGNGLTSSAAATADSAANAGVEQNILAVEQLSDMFLGVSGNTWTVGTASEKLGANDIIVKYTYNGDLSLDGAVDGSASIIFSSYYDNGATSGNTYAYGDLNGDGKINGTDAIIFSSFYGYGLSGSGLPQL